jgi:hypothetical protein
MTTRTCRWTLPPTAQPDGSVQGYLTLVLPTADPGEPLVQTYRVRQPAEMRGDDMASTWYLARRLPNGRYAEPRRVVLGASRDVCSCKFGGRGNCGHAKACRAAMARVAVVA